VGRSALQVISSPWTPQENLDWVGRNTFCVMPHEVAHRYLLVGWYFYDEVSSEHGPFESQDEAICHLLDYCKLYL